MIERYESPTQKQIWSTQRKLSAWQNVELAVIRARANLGLIPRETSDAIEIALKAAPFNIERWLALEAEMNHDLNAFVTERKENLPEDLRRFFHDQLTSYDTEEPAFALILREAVLNILSEVRFLDQHISTRAVEHRYTIMNARTHGQEAEMQSFGKRCLTWLQALRLSAKRLTQSLEPLKFTKLSGAIGNYGSISPELEKAALDILGLVPFFGATQIIPRELYLPVAQALSQIVQSVDKIALDIRLMAQSGRCLVQEPFGKKQTGSSAMPHKKNTITTERLKGMARMAIGFHHMIEPNIETWEERAIEQSSVERVAWPDLFHITYRAVKDLQRIIIGMNVYPDNMLREIIDSRGCYAAAVAKDFLKQKGSDVGLSESDCYRLVQLAAFNVFRPDTWAKQIREKPADSLDTSDAMFNYARDDWRPARTISICDLILGGNLKVLPELSPTEDEVERWNTALLNLFYEKETQDEWRKLFMPSHLLRNENHLFREILGE